MMNRVIVAIKSVEMDTECKDVYDNDIHVHQQTVFDSPDQLAFGRGRVVYGWDKTNNEWIEDADREVIVPQSRIRKGGVQ